MQTPVLHLFYFIPLQNTMIFVKLFSIEIYVIQKIGQMSQCDSDRSNSRRTQKKPIEPPTYLLGYQHHHTGNQQSYNIPIILCYYCPALCYSTSTVPAEGLSLWPQKGKCDRKSKCWRQFLLELEF